MTTRYYHTPRELVTTRVRCPVCEQPVYSKAGIHPQCAVRRSDPRKPKNKGGEFPASIDEKLPAAEQAPAFIAD